MNSTEEESNETQISYLLNIPVEVFLHICSFLDSKNSLLALSKVCRYFNKILNDDFIWKSRIGRRWLPVNEDEEVSWREACDNVEVEAPFLTSPAKRLTHCMLPNTHSSDIHAVHILEGGQLCLTGSRDQDLAVWQLDAQAGFPHQVSLVPSAHKAWIWRITSRSPEDIFTCSFDNSVKQWKLTAAGLQEVATFQCGKAVMSIQLLNKQGLIAAGLTQGVVLLDERSGNNPVHTLNPKFSSFTQLALATVGSDILVATGLRRTLTICDLRTLTESEANITICDYPGHPQCMVEMRGLLYVGDTEGQVHMIDILAQEPKKLQTYYVGGKENFVAMSSTYTSLVTASSSGNIRFWRHQHPTDDWEGEYRPLKTVGLIQPNQEDLCAMHFRDGVLAASLSRNFALNYWLPSNLCA